MSKKHVFLSLLFGFSAIFLLMSVKPTSSYAASTGLNFDSHNQNHIVINNIPVNTAAGAKTTVEFWMNWNGVDNKVPISWGKGEYNLYFALGLFGFNTNSSDVIGITPDFKNKWVYVSAVFTNGQPTTSNVSLYINAIKQKLVKKTKGQSKSPSVNSTLSIGCMSKDKYCYSGHIKDVSVWKGERTGSEIKSDMKGISENESGLLGYWKLDSTNTAVVKDLSRYHNNGIVHGYSAPDFTVKNIQGGEIKVNSDYQGVTHHVDKNAKNIYTGPKMPYYDSNVTKGSTYQYKYQISTPNGKSLANKKTIAAQTPAGLNLTANKIQIVDLNGNPVQYLVKGHKYKAENTYKNTGTANWYTYKIFVYQNGNKMGSIDLDYHTDGVMYPGNTRTNSFTFTAPTTGTNTYSAIVDEGGYKSEETNSNDNEVKQVLSVLNGQLKIVAMNSSRIPSIQLNGSVQTVSAGLNPLEIVNNGALKNWHITVSATPFKGEAGHQLPKGTLSLMNLTQIQVIKKYTNGQPQMIKGSWIIDNGTTYTIATATNAVGQYKMDCGSTKPLKLSLNPASTYVDQSDGKSHYQSTITWTVVSGP